MPLGERDVRFLASLRKARAQLTVYVYTRGGGGGGGVGGGDARDDEEEERSALAAVRAAATHYLGVATFVALLWRSTSVEAPRLRRYTPLADNERPCGHWVKVLGQRHAGHTMRHPMRLGWSTPLASAAIRVA